MSVHISAVKGQTLYTFDQLTPDAQKVAIDQFIQVQRNALKEQMNAHRRKGMHERINNKVTFWAALYELSLYNKRSEKREYFIKVFENNLCHFLADGTYITYSLK